MRPGLTSQSDLDCQTCPNFVKRSESCVYGKELQDSVGSHFDFQAKSQIIKLDQPVIGLYIIKSGLVKLEILNTSGVVATIRIAGPGKFFGYRALFSNEPSYFVATAIEETKVCMVLKEEFLDLITKSPHFAVQLIEQLATDLRGSDERWLAQFGDEAQYRIMRVLLDLDENYPRHHWTKKEISQLAGTTPETVFRVLSKFKSRGFVDVTDHGISISNRTHLLNAVSTSQV